MSDDYRAVLPRTLEHALAYLDALDRAPASASASAEELRRRLDRPLPLEGSPPERVLDELVRDVSGGLVGSAGGRFFAWVVGGSVPASLAADWMTSAWDQNAALHACAPAAAVAEEICGGWLKALLGLPEEASFALVTGCQMAHVTCLAAARHQVLERLGWDVERRGLFGAPPIRLLGGDQRHGSIDRAARLLGLGRDSLIDLPTDAAGRLTAGPLAAALEEAPEAPAIVLLQAGDVNTGAFDPFAELVALAHDHGAWVHVDGAFGLWAATSPEHRSLLRGVEGADSWATDGHKWLNVPYDCGYAVVAHPEAHRAAMTYRASYLSHVEGARDQMDWNPEWSRRARGFATYAALRQLGRAGLAELIARTCRLTRELVEGIGGLPGGEIVAPPVINQGLVRFLDPRAGASPADHDRRTDAVIASILERGEAFFGGTTWRGKRCMRVSISSWQTTRDDVARVIDAVRQAL